MTEIRGPYKVRRRVSERNADMYKKRQSGQTLNSIAMEYSVCRERVRQIVNAVQIERDRADRLASLPDGPQKMEHLNLSVATMNTLDNQDLLHITISEFADISKKEDLRKFPNLGRKTLEVIRAEVKKAGFEVLTPKDPRHALHQTEKRELRRIARAIRNSKICEYWENFRSVEMIAFKLNCSTAVVRQQLMKHKGTTKRKRLNQ